MYINILIVLLVIVIIYSIYKKNKPIRNMPVIKSKTQKHKKKKPIVKKIIKKKRVSKPKNLVFLEIGIGGKCAGKVIIELFDKIVPKTCNNFKTLCTSRKKLSYVDCPFHRIIKDFMIQGGDFTRENGTGGMSIYGEKFEDENFDIPHDRPYLLSMANSGPDTNGSQFFITTAETPHLDGKHVVFGEVIDGFEIIDELNEIETGMDDKPVQDVRIFNCGSI